MKGIYINQQIVKTTAEWAANSAIYPAHVLLFEKLDNGMFNMAISDGVNTYNDLPKVMTEVGVAVKTNTDTEYVLTITTALGSFDTPNLKGPQGDQGIQGIQGEKGDRGDKGDTGTVGIMLDAEPTEDTLTYIVGDVTYNFELGMAAICQDPSADNGRGVYLFKGKTDEGKAIWWKTGSTYQHPSHTAHESGLYKITTDGLGHVSDATAVTKEDITGLGIPAQDTTYEDATTSASGLMSSSDKTKMDRLESYTTSTTVASLDVNYQTIYVTLSKNASLSASGTGSTYNGRSITAYVYTASSVTITIPTSGDYVSMCGSSFTTTAGGWVELSLVCIAGIWHIAKLEAE